MVKEVTDVTSKEVYQVMIDHYNSEDYHQDNHEGEFGKLNKLVDLHKTIIASLGLHEHFIWLQIHVNDKGVTTYKTKDETTAFAYQISEAKEKLLKTAWAYFTELIEFLNQESTTFGYFVPGTDYAENQLIYQNDSFYKATQAFTASDDFDPADWTAVDATEVKFWQWRLSEQFADQANMLFTSYKEFDRFFNIDRNAYFYSLLRYILDEIIEDDVLSRIESLDGIDATLQKKIKRFAAYKAMSIAVNRISYGKLPESVKQLVESKLEKAVGMKQSMNSFQYAILDLNRSLSNKAEDYLREIDLVLAKKELSETEDYVTIPDEIQHVSESDKHISMI